MIWALGLGRSESGQRRNEEMADREISVFRYPPTPHAATGSLVRLQLSAHGYKWAITALVVRRNRYLRWTCTCTASEGTRHGNYTTILILLQRRNYIYIPYSRGVNLSRARRTSPRPSVTTPSILNLKGQASLQQLLYSWLTK